MHLTAERLDVTTRVMEIKKTDQYNYQTKKDCRCRKERAETRGQGELHVDW